MLRLSRFVGAGPPACPISPVPIHRKRGAEFFIFHTVRRHLHPRQPGQILPIKSPGRILLRFFNQIIPPQPKNRQQQQDCQQNHTPYFKSFPHTIFPFLFLSLISLFHNLHCRIKSCRTSSFHLCPPVREGFRPGGTVPETDPFCTMERRPGIWDSLTCPICRPRAHRNVRYSPDLLPGPFLPDGIPHGQGHRRKVEVRQLFIRPTAHLRTPLPFVRESPSQTDALCTASP